MPLRSVRRGSRFVAFGAALVSALLASSRADAQGIVITNSASLERRDEQGNAVTKRERLQREGINLDDCRRNLRIVFPLQISGYVPGDTIQVWTNDNDQDCSQPAARNSATQQCARLDIDVPLTPNPVVTIPIKDIIRVRSSEADETGCRRVRATVNVQFLFLRSASGTEGVAATKGQVNFLVKTTTPEPLTGVRALPGNGGLTVEWDVVGEGGAADITGAKAYCDVNPQAAGGTAPVTTRVCDDAGTEDAGDADADADAAEAGANCRDVTTEGSAAGSIPDASADYTSTGQKCENQAFVGDGGRIVPGPEFARFECGSGENPGIRSLRVSGTSEAPLVNNRMVAVAVAATDSFGNVGELSDAICQFPETTESFWNNYRGSGGGAGGCATSRLTDGRSRDGAEAELPLGSLGVLGVVAAGIGSMMRRRTRAAVAKTTRTHR